MRTMAVEINGTLVHDNLPIRLREIEPQIRAATACNGASPSRRSRMHVFLKLAGPMTCGRSGHNSCERSRPQARGFRPRSPSVASFPRSSATLVSSTDECCRKSGVAATFLRPSWYLTNHLAFSPDVNETICRRCTEKVGLWIVC